MADQVRNAEESVLSPLVTPDLPSLHRSDNSFSFFVFFFVFFCQIGIYIIQLIGIPNLGDR